MHNNQSHDAPKSHDAPMR